MNSTDVKRMAYMKNDIITFRILFTFILSIMYLFINKRTIPPTPYTNVTGPFSTPLGFRVVFLYSADSIMKPNNEYNKKEFK